MVLLSMTKICGPAERLRLITRFPAAEHAVDVTAAQARSAITALSGDPSASFLTAGV